MRTSKRGLGKSLEKIFIENESEDKNSTVMLQIDDIEPNREQPRRDFDEESLSELSESIARYGLLQPILVRPFIGGGYQIVAGERRYRACRMAGLTEVPAIIRELTDSETTQLALIENLQRENLNPIEEAGGYRKLIDEFGLSQEEAAASVGKSRAAVANTLRLLALPQEVADMVVRGELSAGHARALLSLSDESQMIALAEDIVANELSVRQTEKIVKLKKDAENAADTAKIARTAKKPAYFSEVELALAEYLGKRVTVSPLKGKKGGVLQIEFYSDEELAELAKKLE